MTDSPDNEPGYIELIQKLVPVVSEQENADLRQYFEFYEGCRKELTEEAEILFAGHPVFGEMIRQVPREERNKQNEYSVALQRNAILHGDWKTYTEYTVQQGFFYARLGLEFKLWYEVIQAARQMLLPHIMKELKQNPAKAFAVINGINKLIDVAMCITGEAYIYEKKRVIDDQIRQQKNMNAELEQLAYIASHDLQEPLRTLTGFVDLFCKQYSNRLDETGEKYMAYITDAVNRMRSLITGLLEYSRIGKSSQIKEVDCNKLVGQLIRDLDTAIREKNAQVTVAKLPVVRAYEVELSALFQNLILNALKFSKKNSQPVIHIGGGDGRKDWLFYVEDNGIGIDPKFHENIFKLYQRLHSREEYPGSGIGLTHCKKIAELHGGHIWVESAPGEGSKFYFTITKT